MKAITPRQQDALDIIKKWFREKGRPPSQRHLAEEMGIVLSMANYHVANLERAGRIKRAPRLGFNMIQLLDQKCPHCGGTLDDFPSVPETSP